jgi:hypothetical protein
MSANISLNPMLTTTAAGLFQTNSAGYTQGDALDDPAVKFFLTGGVLSTSASTPIWGGVPIAELIYPNQGTPPPGTGPGQVLGATVIQSTVNTEITGFCVYNQAFAGITTPQSPAPLFAPGMSVNYYRLGSGARIPLQIDPALVSLDGSLITTQVSWDFAANQIIAYDAGVGALNVRIISISTANNLTVAYDGVSGFATWATGNVLAVCLI